MNKATLRKWAKKEKEICEDMHLKMLNTDFLSAEMCEDFPEYWLGRIKQLDRLLDFVDE